MIGVLIPDESALGGNATYISSSMSFAKALDTAIGSMIMGLRLREVPGETHYINLDSIVWVEPQKVKRDGSQKLLVACGIRDTAGVFSIDMGSDLAKEIMAAIGRY